MARVRVNEIFHSIQGESTWAGRPCVFVRLTGCNLRCSWCDTAYAFYEGAQMEIAAVMERVRGYGCKLAEITGGEPLLQKGVHALIEALLREEYEVLLETSGEQDIGCVDRRVIKIMDLKCPDSGETEGNRWSNIGHLDARDEVKFVIASRRDYEWARGVIGGYRLDTRVNAVLMSPVYGAIEPAALAGWILEDRLPTRMQLQMHKYIWGAEKRGV
ncbi:MAG: radical SAM protein [Candidatus Binataceae bacterium]